jgi:GNAT superfamily N-acetyltransferase
MVRRALKPMARLLLGPYRFNRIYHLAATAIAPEPPAGMSFGRLESLSAGPVPCAELRDRFYYAGEDAYGYGLFLDQRLAAVCWFWGPTRFHDPLLWDLAKGEAILVDLVTASNFRGRGLAPLLIRYASADMQQAGWRSLYTWMWHTHHASYHAFERAGWEQVASVLEFHPFGTARAIRLCWQPWRRRKAREIG